MCSARFEEVQAHWVLQGRVVVLELRRCQFHRGRVCLKPVSHSQGPVCLVDDVDVECIVEDTSNRIRSIIAVNTRTQRKMLFVRVLRRRGSHQITTTTTTFRACVQDDRAGNDNGLAEAEPKGNTAPASKADLVDGGGG